MVPEPQTLAGQVGLASDDPRPAADQPAHERPRAAGKFLFVGDRKLWLKGVTYGTFRPQAEGDDGYSPEIVEQDFAHIAASGANAIRTYTVPPRWLLDCAAQHGLWVLVGLPWEQHVAFLDHRWMRRSITDRVRAGVRACAGHPAVLAYAIGNEVPAPVVRWHGAAAVERYLGRLAAVVRAEDPGALVTYVNYPSTEYLRLPFLDFLSFNVYLESEERFAAYLARLQNLAGDRPLVISELGLDSRRHGELEQARSLDRQIRASFAAGCSGTFVFSWTDEWHRGGVEIEEWDFGLTSRERVDKPALAAVSRAYAEVPFPAGTRWPRMSVVICSYNGERTIRDTLDGVARLEYPEVEVIVVDDGSTDATAQIAAEYAFRVVSTPNRGLSAARNLGLEMATGEIVAYIDDDAWPDPQWLSFLAATFMSSDHVGVGGPNLAPPTDGAVADAVAHAPGGPTHVLLADQEADHIPGCNCAFRRDALLAIGGFDPVFRVAGDDVDVCWRLRDRGWTLGFHAAAVVWHRRRGSLAAYWKQQRGYGKAEALLERKWPARYNVAGHATWGGRVYGHGLPAALLPRRLYQGLWGTALFQFAETAPAAILWSLPAMPEWYLLLGAMAATASLGLLWTPLLAALPVLALATGVTVTHALASAGQLAAQAPAAGRGWRLRSLIALLFLVQPLARLSGRLGHGLSPWRRRASRRSTWPRHHVVTVWSEEWQAAEARLRLIEERLQADGSIVLRGGAYDRWDLAVRVGALGSARLVALAEEHGAGRQFVRYRIWPRLSRPGLALIGCLGFLGAAAASTTAWAAAAVLAVCALLLASRAVWEAGGATAGFLHTVTER